VTSGRVTPPGLAFEQLAREHPEWSPWLAVVGAAIERAEDPSWGDVRVVPAAARNAGAPFLAGSTISVDARSLERWVNDLVAIAARGGSDVGPLLEPRRASAAWDPMAFVQAAMTDRAEQLDALAASSRVRAELLRSLALPAAMPLLRACARIGGPPPEGWAHGYCPLCGAWPALAEARGLEGSRQLRCGRCGSDWRFDWLRCPFCGNGEHTALGGLVSEPLGAMRKVETCHVCRGYLKTVTTLTARTPAEVVLEDAESAPYDVAAIEAGFSRPATPGYTLGARVEARRRSGLFGFRR
jgi:FdhE protein